MTENKKEKERKIVFNFLLNLFLQSQPIDNREDFSLFIIFSRPDHRKQMITETKKTFSVLREASKEKLVSCKRGKI